MDQNNEMEENSAKSDGAFSACACSSIMEKQKRVLCDLKDKANILPKKVKTEDASLDTEHLHDFKVECQQVVDEFKKLKFAFVHLQGHIKLLDYLANVPKDQWPSVASCDEESKKIRRQLKDAKGEASDLEEHLQNMMKSVQNCQEMLDTKLASITKMMEKVEGVATQVKENTKGRGGAVEELEGGGVTLENFQDENAKQIFDLKAAEEFLARYQPAMKRLKESTEAIRKNQQSALDENKTVMEMVSQLMAKKLDREQQASDKMKWCESASKMLAQLTGVSERSLDDNCWILELTADGCSSVNKESLTAVLTLHFKPGPDPWSPRQISAASIDVDSLDMSDLVEEAVRKNDVPFLVSSVMTRLRTHAPLYMEVEQLRHQYAIDWVPEEGILRVIFGDSAQIVCTLSLSTGPLGTTVVQLKSLEGVRQHPPLDELKPPHEKPRISDWLEYLQEATKSL
ncbi:uncharacterized protein LOC119746480 [Patiria miniata]|uniref:Uncharacterized protein n=1 Tax=Patiria miniata TaxID=46514 RepID=A0A914BU24_PATMI|nr:uncharacterized protein LOC119746480 [Patiria miniata]